MHVLRRIDPQRIDEAVAEILGQIEIVGSNDRAVLVLQADAAFRTQPVGVAVIDDASRFQHGAS